MLLRSTSIAGHTYVMLLTARYMYTNCQEAANS
jgi:hypothetical protein